MNHNVLKPFLLCEDPWQTHCDCLVISISIKDDKNVQAQVLYEVTRKPTDKHVLVSTDGSLYNGVVDCGACSAVLFPISQ